MNDVFHIRYRLDDVDVASLVFLIDRSTLDCLFTTTSVSFLESTQ